MSAGESMVRLQTNMGAIAIKLDRENAPATVDNFLAYARDGFYDATLFHRVIDGFMVQGGGFGPGGYAQKIDSTTHQKRGGQWTEQQSEHHCHGTHRRSTLGYIAVLH